MGICQICSSQLFLAMSPGLVLAAETRDGLQEKGVTMETSRYVTDPVHACMLTMTADNTRESRYFLFDEYLGTTV